MSTKLNRVLFNYDQTSQFSDTERRRARNNIGAGYSNLMDITLNSDNTKLLKNVYKSADGTTGTEDSSLTASNLKKFLSLDKVSNQKITVTTTSVSDGSVTLTKYSLPTATADALGGIKIGYSETGKNYAMKLDSGKAYVSVPWSDTHYTANMYVGAQNATANGEKTNGNVYLTLRENSTTRASFKIVGTGGTTVSSDSSGTITINTSATADTKNTAGLGNYSTGSVLIDPLAFSIPFFDDDSKTSGATYLKTYDTLNSSPLLAIKYAPATQYYDAHWETYSAGQRIPAYATAPTSNDVGKLMTVEPCGNIGFTALAFPHVVSWNDLATSGLIHVGFGEFASMWTGIASEHKSTAKTILTNMTTSTAYISEDNTISVLAFNCIYTDGNASTHLYLHAQSNYIAASAKDYSLQLPLADDMLATQTYVREAVGALSNNFSEYAENHDEGTYYYSESTAGTSMTEVLTISKTIRLRYTASSTRVDSSGFMRGTLGLFVGPNWGSVSSPNRFRSARVSASYVEVFGSITGNEFFSDYAVQSQGDSVPAVRNYADLFTYFHVPGKQGESAEYVFHFNIKDADAKMFNMDLNLSVRCTAFYESNQGRSYELYWRWHRY